MDSNKRVLGQNFRRQIRKSQTGSKKTSIESHHSSSFTQRSWMVENIRQLLPIGLKKYYQFDCIQDAGVPGHDFHLERNQLFADVVGSSSSE